MNIFEVLKGVLNPDVNHEALPLHIGEAYHLWYYLAGVEQMIRNDQVALNTVKDVELKEIIEDLIANVHKPIRDDITAFLQHEGVPLPQTTPEKPLNGPFLHLPEGAVLSDEEVANLLSWGTIIGIQIGVRGMTESVRADVAAMFSKYQIMQLTWSVTMKNMMSKRGWIKVPPCFRDTIT